MPPSTLRLTSLAALAATGLLLWLAGPASALAVPLESPPEVSDEITDTADFFGGRTGEVQEALDRLADETRFQLFVVFVDSFDGWDPTEWAHTSATESGLGVDDVLLAVAVADRKFGISVDDQMSLTDDQLESVASDIENQLRQNDWPGAAIAAANGYRRAADDEGGTSGGESSGDQFGLQQVAVVGAVVLGVAVVIGLIVLVRRRRPAATVMGPDGKPVTGPAALPTKKLNAVASSALVAVDDALKASEQELGFAQAQFGLQTTKPFADVIATGKETVARAFALRKQLDDSVAETEPQRRELLLEIVRLCEEIDTSLDEQTAEFARLRDLHARAPEVLAEIGVRAAEVQGRLPAAGATLDQLAATYAATSLVSVQDSVDRATALLCGVEENVAAGQTAVATDRAQAVSFARLAEDAVAQAVLLLDGVDRAGAELAEASRRIDASLASLGTDVTDAALLAPDDPAAAQAAAAARQVIASVEAGRSGEDPLTVLRRLADAETTLDAALAPVREQAAQAARMRSRLTRMLGGAGSQVNAVTAFIDSHRNDVGAQARTELAEATRLTSAAEQMQTDDPDGALAAAQRAEQVALVARRLAEDDVEDAGRAARIDSGTEYGSVWGGGWGGSGGLWDDGGGIWDDGNNGGNGGWGGGGGSGLWGGGGSSSHRTRSSSGRSSGGSFSWSSGGSSRSSGGSSRSFGGSSHSSGGSRSGGRGGGGRF